MQYERQTEPMATRQVFLRRLVRNSAFAISILLLSLGLGVIGYHSTEGLPWIDALLNASMLLGGMGPVAELHTIAGKLFASFYALFSGIVLLAAAGVIIAPLFHRFLHHFHLEIDQEDG